MLVYMDSTVEKNDHNWLPVGHKVSQSDTSKYLGVTIDVAIVAGKLSRKINTSRNDKFIKSNESSWR